MRTSAEIVPGRVSEAGRQAEARVFVLAAVAISLSVWEIAFTLGTFETVFFDKIFAVWVASSAALLASFFIPAPEGRTNLVAWRGRAVLFLPSSWVAVELTMFGSLVGPGIDAASVLIGAASILLALPYTLYILVVTIVPDVDNLRSPRLVAALVGIVLTVAGMGYAVGRNHQVFLTCRDFVVSGNDVPTNCTDASGQTAQTRTLDRRQGNPNAKRL